MVDLLIQLQSCLRGKQIGKITIGLSTTLGKCILARGNSFPLPLVHVSLHILSGVILLHSQLKNSTCVKTGTNIYRVNGNAFFIYKPTPNRCLAHWIFWPGSKQFV